MKPAAKNIMVAILAAGAVGFSGWTVFGSRLMSRRSATTPAAVPPAVTAGAATLRAAAATAAAAPELTNSLRLIPSAPIDVEYVQANLARWMEAPARDPFAVYQPPQARETGPRAADVLSLRAIWRQTGGQLAVINGRVVGEGERISGFQIVAIEQSRVRVRGSNGVEQIEFVAGRPRPATNTLAGPPRPAGPIPSKERTLSP